MEVRIMRSRCFVAALSGLVLLSSLSAGAATFCEQHPTSPVCSAEIAAPGAVVEIVEGGTPPADPDPVQRADLAGTSVLKGPGFHVRNDATMALTFRDDL